MSKVFKKENQLALKVTQYLEKKYPNDHFLINSHGGSIYQKSGIPDLVVCFFGHYIGLELKLPYNQATPLQKAKLNKINKAGGCGVSLDDYDTIIELLEEIKEWDVTSDFMYWKGKKYNK